MYNFIDGDFFESLADFSFGDMYSTNIQSPSYSLLKSIFEKVENPILFIETHRLPILFKELSYFSNDVRIIAHNSDQTFGSEILPHIPKNVKKLYCQNYNFTENDIIKSLPIGLERIRWFPEQKKQEVLNKSVVLERKGLVYVNFNPNTNSIRYQYFNEIKEKGFCNIEMVGNGGDYNNYVNNLERHKYIVSPPGNGIDCHRTWEALYTGCIPIVLDCHFNRNIYNDLPVLIIDSYSNITEDLLLNNYDLLKQKSDKIYKSYWENLIKNG